MYTAQGQWALTVQSARVSANHVGSHYPILDRVVADAAAHDANPAGFVCAMPIVVDLALAWKNSVAATRRAVTLRFFPQQEGCLPGFVADGYWRRPGQFVEDASAGSARAQCDDRVTQRA